MHMLGLGRIVSLGISLAALVVGFVFVLDTTGSKAASAADTRSTFNSRCASCHGRDGRGRTARGRRTHTRDLTDSSWQNDVSDERLFNSIHNGRTRMPAFKKSLSESEIDALVTYVRQLRR